MSHFVTIKTQITDIDALRAACTELGLTLTRNAQARGFGSDQRHGDYVIHLKGPFDIAVNQQPHGTFTFGTDWWDGHVEKEVGTHFGRLLQLYAVHKAAAEARKRGLNVQRTTLKSGAIKLCIAGGAL